MTYYDISKKMLRFGFDRYRLYFLCNVSAAALFCCFALIFSNRTFMNEQIVNSSISGNIFLPAVVSAVFLIFFSAGVLSGISVFQKAGVRSDVFSGHEQKGRSFSSVF